MTQKKLITIIFTIVFLVICYDELFSQKNDLFYYNCEKIITGDEPTILTNCALSTSDSTVCLRLNINCNAELIGYSEINNDTLNLYSQITNEDEMSFSFCYYNLYYRVFNANRIKSVLHNGKTIPYNEECEVKLKYTVLNDKNKFKVVQKYWGNILKSDYFFKEDKIIIREYEHGKLIKTITTPRK